jgi:squalene-hopene/tetraprenyl-beta-curcumene cyclase
VTGDPSCPAITGRVLEALGHFGFRVGQPPVDAAVRFILARQELCGGWRNRWGAGALQATWPVLAGLGAVGCDVYGLPVRRAVRWLKEAQDGDAAWGGPTETAWAVLALLAASEGESPEAQAGAEFLAGTQRADGTWAEREFPSTGLAPDARHRHELDALCFPLTALARYASDRGRPAQPRKALTRTDAGHAVGGPKGYRHTLAEM